MARTTSAFAMIGGAIMLSSAACSVATSEGIYMGQAADALRAYRVQELTEWSEVGSLQSGKLGENEIKRDTMHLGAGRRLGILASCDDDCGDLDLSVEDANGFIMEREEDDSAEYPFVQFETTEDGIYVVRVNMEQCSATTCFYTYLLLETRPGGNGE